MDHPGRFGIITGVLKSERRKQDSQRRCQNRNRGQSDAVVGFEDQSRPEPMNAGSL